MVIISKQQGVFDLILIRNIALIPQIWLVNPVIDQRTYSYCISNDIQNETDAE
jgi:hypothetical protein